MQCVIYYIMAREDIYKKAFQSLIDEKLTKQELWELVSEHFEWLDSDNEKLKKDIKDMREKYGHLLKQVNEAHDNHKKFFRE